MADRYALVVGIAEYKTFTRLAKVPASALAVAQLLQKQGQFRIDMHPVSQWIDAETPKAMGTRLTGDELWQAMETFFRNTAQDGDALFYFCGHGFIVRDRYNPNQQEAYLATSDTSVTLENGQVISQERGISFQNLVNLFSQSHLRSLVVLLDCCHAGSLLEESVVENFLSNPNRDCSYRLIAACRASESAYEGSQHYTIFTDALMKALTPDRADEEGQISDGRVWEFLQRTLKGRIQKPVSISLRDPITLVSYNQPGKSTPAPSQVRSENPYMGLLSFEEVDADRFFGRDNASWELLNDLRDNRFLAVVGDSGSGKSSLVKAGLLPKLRTGQSLPGSDQWQIEPMTPGRNPDVRLQAILVRHTENQPLLVFIDQFEEVFTQCDDEAEKRAFMRRITEAVTQPEGSIRFVITIRGDFLTRCGEYEIADLINASKPRGYIVKAMTQDELRDAIAKPALSQGVQFESHLVDRIIEDVESQPGALPLLQHALKELWRVCIETDQSAAPILTWAAYEQIGGVAGALEKQADHRYTSFNSTEQAFTRRLFVQELVKQEGQTYTRRRASCSGLEKIAPSKTLLDRVIDGFTSDRLLVTGILPQPDISQVPGLPQSFVEIAHEALLEKWTRLKTWLQEDQEKIDLLQQLRTNFDNWKTRYQQSENALLMGALLANIEEKLDWQTLEPEETDYVKKSLERRDREQQEKRRKERQRWLLAAGLLATITAASLGFAYQARKMAIARSESNIQTLVSLAKNQFENHQQLDSLVTSIQALESLRQLPVSTNQKQQYVDELKPIVFQIQERNRFEKQESRLYGLSIHPNFGKMKDTPSSDMVAIASGDFDGNIKLWNIYGKVIRILPKDITTSPKDALIWNLKFNHRGTLLASSGYDGKIRLWSLESGNKLVLPGHQGGEDIKGSYGLSFNDDDRLLVSSGLDSTVKIWSVTERPKLNAQLKDNLNAQYQGRTSSIEGVDFKPGSEWIIAYSGGGYNNAVRIWNRHSSKQILVSSSKQEAYIDRVKFSPDGAILVASNNLGIIKIWAVGHGLKQLAEFQAHPYQGIYDIAFGKNQNGNLLLASASRDQTIKLWDLNKIINMPGKPPEPLVILLGHVGPVNRIEFSPDNKFIVSTSDDGTIRFWEWKPEVLSKDNIKLDQLVELGCKISESYRLNPYSSLESKKICKP